LQRAEKGAEMLCASQPYGTLSYWLNLARLTAPAFSTALGGA
jgi:hypothetical protein